jgi:hypothetical protein
LQHHEDQNPSSTTTYLCAYQALGKTYIYSFVVQKTYLSKTFCIALSTNDSFHSSQTI